MNGYRFVEVVVGRCSDLEATSVVQARTAVSAGSSASGTVDDTLLLGDVRRLNQAHEFHVELLSALVRIVAGRDQKPLMHRGSRCPVLYAKQASRHGWRSGRWSLGSLATVEGCGFPSQALGPGNENLREVKCVPLGIPLVVDDGHGLVAAYLSRWPSETLLLEVCNLCIQPAYMLHIVHKWTARKRLFSPSW